MYIKSDTSQGVGKTKNFPKRRGEGAANDLKWGGEGVWGGGGGGGGGRWLKPFSFSLPGSAVPDEAHTAGV